MTNTKQAKTRSRPNAEYVLYARGEPVAVNADGDTSYFGTDILGSVRSVTDKYGAVKAQYEYDAFGSPYLSNIDSGMSFGYTGKIFDSATGLYDYGFRDYSPNSARFTTVDPVRDGSNWFAYVVSDPVNYIDPFGLTPYDVPNQTYLGDKDGKSYFRVDEGGTKWGLANATGTPLNEVNGYDGVAESMPIGTILSIPSQINNSGTTPSNSNNAINTSPAITAQSFSQSSSFAPIGMGGGETGGSFGTAPTGGTQGGAGINSASQLNYSAVKKVTNFIKACEAKVYVDVCVGGGISADILGLGAGGDIGSEHATFTFNFKSGEKPKFDYQETMTIGLEIFVVIEGSTPTPASARSFTSSTQEEPPANGKAPIENMQYSWSYGPVAVDKDGITLNINTGVQAVLGIEVGGEIKIPWDALNELWSSD